MFRINPGEARTDLYGIGKGQAQVIDFKPTRERLEFEAKQAQEKEAKKAKAVEEKQSKMQDLLKTSLKGDVLPKEQPFFAEQAAKIKDFVISKMSANGDISPSDMLEAQFQIADLQQRALVSKNYKESLEAEIVKWGPNIDKYAVEDRQKVFDAYNRVNPDDIGTNYEPIQISPMMDWMDYVEKTLLPLAKSMKDQNGRLIELTEPRAKELVESTVANPIMGAQLDKVYKNSTDAQKLGTKDYTEWAIKTAVPALMSHKQLPYPTGGTGGGSRKAGATDVLVDYTPDGISTVSVTGKKNEAVEVPGKSGETKKLRIISPEVKYDDNGNFLSATGIDLDIKDYNNALKKDYDDKMSELNKKLTDSNIRHQTLINEILKGKSINELSSIELAKYSKENKIWQSESNVINNEFKKVQKNYDESLKDENRTLNEDQVKKAFSRLTGYDPIDIYQNKQGEDINRIESGVKGKGESAADTSGEKMIRIKGKDYKESIVAEKAKASGMSIEEYVNELNK